MVFNAQEFFRALDRVRIENKLQWKDVAEQSQVNASTLSRLQKSHSLSASNLALLCLWADLDVRNFCALPRALSRGKAQAIENS